ncbi:MBL fold metallo-hydrolase [Parasphingorhabdus cellanae]|uniref:MBL fold metallo-hydrolase n=1 Tax=Parasphingorhabdus cellanae TaxID=2806553 RepID=A0ABX7T6G1_9SPHN|nr:MBL fold metallo-hydrolase [Parasphingorhabdus cellanae]QTD56711.1 MBL fold metallo-hydrolase [Parasphingorhabdus cellanae]
MTAIVKKIPYWSAAATFALLTACVPDTANDAGNFNIADTCRDNPFALQVLGSGGPIADDHRAGASNILWIDGKARLLVDAGSGAFVRYGEAGIDFNDHDAILFTHLHGDHASGLPALLNNGAFAARTEALTIAGPSGNDQFPSTVGYLDALIGKDRGALRYLHPYLEDNDALPRLTIQNIDSSKTGLQRVWDQDDLQVDAIAVHHLDVPALAYIIRAKGKTIVMAGDQSFLSEDFVQTLAGTKPDLLVMHNAITMADGQPRGLHRDPKSIGETAGALDAKTLLLTHHMQRAVNVQDQVNAAIAKNYGGPVLLADDLSCHPI